MATLEATIASEITDLPDFRRLIRHIERGCGTFSMVFVIWDRADTEHAVYDAIRTAVPGGRIAELPLPSGDAADIFRRIEGAGTAGCDALVVEGLYRAFPQRLRFSPDDRPPILQALNLYRDRLRRNPSCLVLLLPEHALDLIALASPDFWSWRSGIFSPRPPAAGFATTQSTLETPGSDDDDMLLSVPEVQAEVVRLTGFWSQRFDDDVPRRELSAAARIAERLVTLYRRLARFALAEQWRERAISLLDQIVADLSDPMGRADALVHSGILWNEAPLGTPAENQRRAIAAYENALSVYTHDAHPIEWARTQNSLGVAWGDLPTGDRADNLRRAIAAYQAALSVRTRDAHPVEWAMTQRNLGIAWRNLPTGDRTDNLRRAITAYEAALRVYTREAHPVAWAMTQNNLANAWGDLPSGDRADNLQRAIAAYEDALSVYPCDAHPADWARTQSNRAIALAELAECPGEDRCARLRQAIACGKAALIVRTPKAFPADYAITGKNLRVWRSQYEAAGCAEAVPFDGIAPADRMPACRPPGR